jgi:hypothetical protein
MMAIRSCCFSFWAADRVVGADIAAAGPHLTRGSVPRGIGYLVIPLILEMGCRMWPRAWGWV